MKKLVHLDLFSGIGGFALAVDRVWPGSTHIFCDNDLFCQEVLKKHWPDSKIYGDIRSITKESFTTDTTDSGGGESSEPGGWGTHSSGLGNRTTTDLLTGGFPCQPFSQAGRRRGTSDDRYLWPEMLRVIEEARPQWVIGENVAGIEHMDFDGMLAQLEDKGYQIEVFDIPACAVGAPHKRRRFWIVAHANCIRFQRVKRGVLAEQNKEREWHIKTFSLSTWGTSNLCSESKVLRINDGLPDKLDRIKSLGNAIVPQVAYEIMSKIKEIESQ